MRDAKKITAIVIHCSAGFGDKQSIQKFWKSQGWTSPGYHRLIGVLGEVHVLARFDEYTNGVKGHNTETLHICYIGGVEKKGDKFVAKDTRTDKQKESIIYCIKEAQKWLASQGVDVSKVAIKGHRDFSKDQNGDGVIASWERIKECPSFEAIAEYKYLIPAGTQPAPQTFGEYTVKGGDTLSEIAAKYSTTVAVLKSQNHLTSDVIKVGQKLKV